jgi:hypothetical protein
MRGKRNTLQTGSQRRKHAFSHVAQRTNDRLLQSCREPACSVGHHSQLFDRHFRPREYGSDDSCRPLYLDSRTTL